MSGMSRIERLPAWVRPAVYGALLITGMVSIRVLFALVIRGPSLQLFRMLGMGVLAGAYLGGVGGVTYSLVRPTFRKLGRPGDYLTGIACATAYLLAFGLPGAIWFKEPMFLEASGWIIMGVLAVVFGLIIGHSWFREI